MQSKRISDLLQYLNLDLTVDESLTFNAITCDSRKVKSGTLFLALKGITSDGHNYLDSIHEKGAVCALVEHKNPNAPVLQIAVPDTRELWGKSISWLHDRPEEKLAFIGLTGTNGKTTTSYILEKILNDNGVNTGIIGTIEYRFNERRVPSPFTSPDPEILYPLLDEMVQGNVKVVIMEVSSHGLAQERVKGLRFDAALLTNFTQDHLDFHHTMEEYARAKRLLFTHHLKEGALVAAWADSAHLDDIVSPSLQRVLYSLGDNPRAHYRAVEHNLTLSKLTAHIVSEDDSFTLSSLLIGEHNILNILGAAILAGRFGVSMESALKSAYSVTVPGRLERVEGKVPVFVDYAHTPDALDRAQEALLPLVKGRLITVFGCGGDRDVQKRPLMGASVDSRSHIAIVTSDNPR
ncbi:UDP-N-acetylmuramoyl-L-alanyl-D-glutamate--2,6-diaminopimelate ligase, partial [Myxococcota bacterium]|nr:UDP-N-acetylmuramoyl-L-alanyl-D-glutamate--2,6-diaminopimelate ligase [Myxococcota bacterium]